MFDVSILYVAMFPPFKKKTLLTSQSMATLAKAALFFGPLFFVGCTGKVYGH
jgi:hypothetical protein